MPVSKLMNESCIFIRSPPVWSCIVLIVDRLRPDNLHTSDNLTARRNGVFNIRDDRES